MRLNQASRRIQSPFTTIGAGSGKIMKVDAMSNEVSLVASRFYFRME
jgi:hypothetical protein